MNKSCLLHKNGALLHKETPLYGIAGVLKTVPGVQSMLTAAGIERAVRQSAVRFRFARQYLYRLIVSRLARAGVIMSGALTPIDVL